MQDSIFEIFREEAREHLGALEKGFLDLETAAAPDARRGLIDHLFRHAHSLKGDAKVVGLPELKVAAQNLEDLLDEFRDKPQAVNRSSINRGLDQLDRVKAAFEAFQKSPGGQAPPAVAAPDTPDAATVPTPPPARVSTPAAPANAAPDSPTPESASGESFTVRVAAERLDRMLTRAAEVRTTQRGTGAVQARLADVSEHLAGALREFTRQSATENRHALEFALDQIRRISGELHNQAVREELQLESLESDIRQARLLPLVMLTDVLRRAVRDLSRSLGKPIRFEAETGAILLDKAVIEALRDPLMHIVRNAADHGVESPDGRRAAGKPPEGLIRIDAVQQGQSVRLKIRDDGGGLPYAQIRERVRQTGGLDDDQLDALADQELIPYLFKPGFTTARPGEVSGRGVGLDVVANTLRTLHGSIDVQSSSAAGTVFVLTVPVTISTVRILTVSAGGQHFGIPSADVLQTGRARREDLRSLDGGLVLSIGGRIVPWIRLADAVNAGSDLRAENDDAWSYLLIAHDGGRTAVAVDDLEDESEVLLKPLGFPLAGLAGVVGATIRTDGSVQLVLDLASPNLNRSRSAPRPVAEVQRSRKILVVDDSPTTRAVLRNVFTAAGYAVTTAIDGIDALERLRMQPADLVVSDVEMPRLNGFDLTRQIKARFGLPVVLVTACEKDEQRREGLDAGADAFVVKSTFEETSLLEIVEQLA